MAHIAALIMAAGRGERFAGGATKQLALVGGRPMVAWSIERMANCPDIEHVLLVIPPAQSDAWRATLAEPSGELVDGVVEGGERRQDSVRKSTTSPMFASRKSRLGILMPFSIATIASFASASGSPPSRLPAAVATAFTLGAGFHAALISDMARARVLPSFLVSLAPTRPAARLR